MAMNPCSLCRNVQGNTIQTAREMMFGFRDRFRYLECARCGCLQLLDIPQNMARYYPAEYYSFQHHGWAKTYLRRRWSKHALGTFTFPGWLFSLLYFPNKAMESVRRMNPAKDARILDVGCGSGRLLLDLQHHGYRQVTGADPYLATDLRYPGGLVIHKKTLAEMGGSFDLIMLHHSFEHMEQPAEVFKGLARLLTPTGTIILRIPVAASYGWRHYGINWINLDAPRHLFLHTEASVGLLAEQSGLRIRHALHEADDGVFWASQAYADDIPMSDPRFPYSNTFKRVFGLARLQRYRKQAAEVNRQRQADQICFELVKAQAVKEVGSPGQFS